MKLLLIFCSINLLAFIEPSTPSNKKVFSKKEARKLQLSGLQLNKPGKIYLEKKEKIKKNQIYEIKFRCLAASHAKCKAIELKK